MSFFWLIESKGKALNKDKVLRAIDGSWKVLCNYDSSPNGRIWVCWNPEDVDVTVLNQSDQIMHCQVRAIAYNWSCLVSIVYGENSSVQRESLWNDIVSQASVVRGNPLMIAGDFNAIRNHNDRVGGSSDWPIWMDDFEACISQAEMEDLRFAGQLYTWSNRREEGPIFRKLDRTIVNLKGENRFPGSVAHFLPAGISGRSPMVVKLAEMPRVKKAFRFFDFWAECSDFLPLVKEVWRTEVRGTPMYQLCTKWKRLKMELKKLNRNRFSDLSNRQGGARGWKVYKDRFN